MASIDLTEYLRNGVQRSHRTPTNTPYMEDCANLQVTEFGLRPWLPFVEPDLAGLGITRSWPWPQVIVGQRIILLINNNAIYELDRNTLAPTLITVRNWTLYDHSLPNTLVTLSVPTGTQHWQFADLNDAWMLTRNGCTIFKTALNSAVFGVTTPTIECAATHLESRLFLGNFANQFAAIDWEAFLDDYEEFAPSIYKGLGAAMNTSWVWWSSVNAPDMLLWIDGTMGKRARPVMTTTPPAIDTGFGGSGEKHYIMDLMRQNQFGARPMPWKGKVLGFHEMSSGMLVFGEDGVCALYPHENTYGMKLIDGLPLGLGARSRDAWAGNKQAVLFCDKAGKLWQIDAQFQAVEVDYEHVTNDLSASTFHMNFEERRKEYWYADGSNGYCLTASGLSRTPKMATSIINYGSGGLGVWLDTSSPTIAWFLTKPITAKAVKMEEGRTFVVKGLRFKMEYTTAAITAKLYWRMTNNEQWTVTSAVAVDVTGYVPFGIRCKEFKVYLAIDDRTLVDGVEAMEVEVLQNGPFNVYVTKIETAPTLATF